MLMPLKICREVKLCLYIPSIPIHFESLLILMRTIKFQTRQPDEIIISISDSHLIKNLSKLFDITKKLININIKILSHNKSLDAAQNRNFFNISNSDVIVYQDSDDLMHKQRLEILDKIFVNNCDIVNVNHSYIQVKDINKAIKLTDKESIIDYKKISFINPAELFKHYFPSGNYLECQKYKWYSEGLSIDCAAGVISVRKKQLQEIGGFKQKKQQVVAPFRDLINYKGAEDYEMCMELLFKYKKSIITNAKIYYYVK